ncbi:FAD/NAD(P)-binding domain-containing protein [Rhizopus microsporus var. microsporus]|uniref:FAD/NAD(P)-binding domain-containing protein n=1 Tax=Rhizopus microsporus var. microsporus TaxID=86635 RepID=A0A1X0R4E3_RHIZD|nr:FAD/NAD(P)-binding domain-containing protein [Rhizopus microsporus var. microsporus]
MTTERVVSFQELVDLIHNDAQVALDHPFIFKKPIKNVAVIGAGPYGLCSARHLRDAGLNVKVFERNSSVGGIWKYSDTAPPKPKMPTSRISLDDGNTDDVPKDGTKRTRMYEITPELRQRIFRKCPPSGCYRDLFTNIPSQHLAYPDFAFPEGTSGLVTHQEMLAYFERYATTFNLMELIDFGTSVDIAVKTADDEWELVLSKYDVYPSGFVKETKWREKFDAVVAASGVHQEPYVPDIKDLTAFNKMWPVKVAHSKQFRRPEDFKDKAISGVDIARSLEGFAKSITMALKGDFTTPFPVENIIRAKIPKCVDVKCEVASFSNPEGEVDGSITFQDGTVLNDVDQVIFCTGYTHSLGYLDGLIIREEEYQSSAKPKFIDVPPSHVVLGRKYPLNAYHEVFLMSDPTLCFVGMPRMFSITPYFDTQAQVVARVWSGNACIPTAELMCQLADSFNPGLPLDDLYACDRRRREIYVGWLNYQAEKLGKADLPEIKNFDESYEEEGARLANAWGDLSEANFQNVKQRLLNELETC